ncbi:MAG: polysaccharide pyruvyl transferase family protein [Bacilli bacterium]
MIRTLLINPAISTLNVGDEIIADGVKKAISSVLSESFVTEVSSHLPLSYMYKKAIGECNLKFVCGSNLLMGKMNGRFKQWQIGFKDIAFMKGSILVGVGWWQYNNDLNLFTYLLYKKILNKKYIHSVRDSYTEKKLKEMGVMNVINTGCPTLWSLTQDHCNCIKKTKSNTVVFTITDYNKNYVKDKELINTLVSNYKNVYFWPQGVGDLKYFEELEVGENITVISPTLKAYDEFLELYETDYVGTRLHGGIRALQKKRRTIIISIDNRAKEKEKDFNIKCVSRENISTLHSVINSDFKTEIMIPLKNIEIWKNQFIDKTKI